MSIENDFIRLSLDDIPKINFESHGNYSGRDNPDSLEKLERLEPSSRKPFFNLDDEKIYQKQCVLSLLPDSLFMSLQDYQKGQVVRAMELLFGAENLGNINHIVDATCHVGCDSINFSEIFPNSKITCIDNDIEAIKVLKKNILSLKDPDRFNIIYGDCTTFIKSQNVKADIFYFDPPWGGYGYLKKTNIDLVLGNQDISSITSYCLTYLTSHVLIKAPRNFNIKKFSALTQAQVYKYKIIKPSKKSLDTLTTDFNKNTDSTKNIAYYLLYVKRA